MVAVGLSFNSLSPMAYLGISVVMASFPFVANFASPVPLASRAELGRGLRSPQKLRKPGR